MKADHAIHELAYCGCGTVVRDCGCRLRPVYRRTCDACRAAREQLEQAAAQRWCPTPEVGGD